MNITIRKAKIEEISIVQELNHKLFLSDLKNDSLLDSNWPYGEGKKYFESRIGGEGVCLLASVGEKAVGYIAGNLSSFESWRKEVRVELENMFVEEKFRGNDIGASLVDAFIEWSKEKKADHIFLSVYVSNQSAQNFYKKKGFGVTNLFMERKI